MSLAQAPAVGSPSRVAYASDPTIIGAVVLNPDGTVIGGSSGTTTVQFAPITQNIVGIAASGSQVIPAGAKEWTFAILTGTGTYAGVAVAAGFSDGSPKPTVAAITITTDAASTAIVRWGT